MKNKIDGQISISRPSFGDGTELISIRVRDNRARIEFLEIEIGYEEFTKAITGLSGVPCELIARNLISVGKINENDSIEFELPRPRYNMKDDELEKLATKYTPKGWEPPSYFGSRDNFFSKDGKDFCRATITRWV